MVSPRTDRAYSEMRSHFPARHLPEDDSVFMDSMFSNCKKIDNDFYNRIAKRQPNKLASVKFQKGFYDVYNLLKKKTDISPPPAAKPNNVMSKTYLVRDETDEIFALRGSSRSITPNEILRTKQPSRDCLKAKNSSQAQHESTDQKKLGVLPKTFQNGFNSILTGTIQIEDYHHQQEMQVNLPFLNKKDSRIFKNANHKVLKGIGRKEGLMTMEAATERPKLNSRSGTVPRKRPQRLETNMSEGAYTPASFSGLSIYQQKVITPGSDQRSD